MKTNGVKKSLIEDIVQIHHSIAAYKRTEKSHHSSLQGKEQRTFFMI
jgi:hypothetical protein